MKVTFTMKHLLYVSLIALASCSSPSGDGVKCAEVENQYAKECIEAIHALESDFVTGFDPADYTFRQQALDEYAKRFKNIVEGVEARKVSPENVGNLALKILEAKRPRQVYKINRNPLLLLLNVLPSRLATFIIKLILKK